MVIDKGSKKAYNKITYKYIRSYSVHYLSEFYIPFTFTIVIISHNCWNFKTICKQLLDFVTLHNERSVFMYDVNKTVSIIKSTAKEQGVSISTMLTDIGINKNTLSSMSSRGSWVSSDTLAKIADYLGVSVDYLLCREQNEKSTPDNNAVRSAVIEKVNNLPDSSLDRLLGYLEALEEE